MTRRGWLLFIALGIIWGLPYLLIRVSVREVSPATLVFVRTCGGALLLSPLALRRGALLPLLRHWKAFLAYTVAEVGIPWLLLFSAEKKLSSSLAGLLIAAVPIAGAVLAQVTRTDRLDRRRIAGLLLGVLGVAALVGLDVSRSNLLAALSLIVVAIGYAVGPWILSRYLTEVPAMSVIAGSLALCAVAYAPAAALELPSRPLSGAVIASMAALTFLCTAVAFVALFALVGEVGPTRAVVITYVNPAVAVVLGVTVLGEQFGVATGVGFALILMGSFLSTLPSRAPAAIRRAREDSDASAPPVSLDPG